MPDTPPHSMDGHLVKAYAPTKTLAITGHGIASTQRRLWCTEHIAGAQVSLDNHELSHTTVTVCP